MKSSTLTKAMFAARIGAIALLTTGGAASAQQHEETAAPIVVHGATPLTPIAPAWQQDANYKFGDYASYDGFAFKAKTGSAHRRPNVNSEVGWELMNSCDDHSKGAVKCELGNQTATVETVKPAQQEFQKMKDYVDPQNR